MLLVEVAHLYFAHTMLAQSELVELSLALAVLNRNTNATPLLCLLGSQKMPNIELDVTAGELEQHNLDCYETTTTAEQAETVWVETAVKLPWIASFFEERGVVKDVPEGTPLIQESMGEYTRAMGNLEGFLIPNLDSYTFSIRENVVQMTKPFVEYDEGKEWVGEIEDRLSGLPSQVTLEVFDHVISEQSLCDLNPQREPAHNFEVGQCIGETSSTIYHIINQFYIPR